jgi:hypothetical protein
MQNHHQNKVSSKTDKILGSGLGLFISRELVELQGGQVGVYSEAGKGSTFGFYIMATRVERRQEIPPASPEICKSQPVPSPTPVAATLVEASPISTTTTQDLHVLGKYRISSTRTGY